MSDISDIAKQVPLPWQVDQWQQLLAQKSNNQLAHSYLFAGSAGLGKRLFAEQFARYLLCSNPESNTACNSCNNCILGKDGSHPDLLQLEPEDGARDIKIDQIRTLSDFVVRTSHSGGARIAIVDRAHQMNVNAANALLKTLEEPTDATYLILLSDSPGSLSATIRSRCQRLKFSIPSLDLASDWLIQTLRTQQGNDPDADPIKLLAASNNRPLFALELVGNGGMETRQDYINSLCDLQLGKQTIQAVLNLSLKIGESAAIGHFLTASTILMKSLISDVQRPESVDSNDAALNELPSQLLALKQAITASSGSPKASLHHLMGFYQEVLLAKRQLLSSSNPNPQLIMESLLWQWKQLPLGSTS